MLKFRLKLKSLFVVFLFDNFLSLFRFRLIFATIRTLGRNLADFLPFRLNSATPDISRKFL